MSSLTGEFFDYYQEIARSAFADMLHDTERNQKYYQALKKAIDKLHARNQKAHVLDIGTGTALLSMMAVRCGADSVTACEAFLPMADCAERIIEHNSLRDTIHLIKKRSTDIRVGDGKDDMLQRANILVTEVFDTELIGEGAIQTFNLAHEHLLEKDCIVVPDSATIYVQVIQSPLVRAWNTPKLMADLDGEVLLRTPTEILECRGSCELHDIQLNQLSVAQFREIVAPKAAFEFDFSGKNPISKSELVKIPVVTENSGSAQAFFMWWILKMDQEGEIKLSCAPHWQHEDFQRLSREQPNYRPQQNVIPWRDHWMQAIYHIPKEIHVDRGQNFELHCARDEFSLWFDLMPATENNQIKIDEVRPLCTCGFHLAYSRTRIGQVNDNLRTKKFIRVLEEEITSSSTVFFISDGSLIGLAIAALGAKHVYLLDSNQMSRRVLETYVQFNKLANVTLVSSIDDEGIDWTNISHIIGEPYFCTSILPWDNFQFGEIVNGVRDRVAATTKILPRTASIRAVPVEFLDLHKIVAPFKTCESFDLSIFDRIIEESSEMTDAVVEAQPLWEYPNKALGQPETVFTVDFTEPYADKTFTKDLHIEGSGICNAIAFWTEYSFSDSDDAKRKVDTGALNDIRCNEFITWDMHSRQGVHLMAKPLEVNENPSVACTISCKNHKFTFSLQSGE